MLQKYAEVIAIDLSRYSVTPKPGMASWLRFPSGVGHGAVPSARLVRSA